jgi:hypothetical protein
MNDEHHPINPDQAERITREIAQTFEFLGDVIDNPRILGQIPDGSALSFRDVHIEGHAFRLTAYRSPRMRQWAARVTGMVGDGQSNGLVQTDLPRPVRGATDAAALDALETRLRTVAARMPPASFR